jgi:hypothetical protein
MTQSKNHQRLGMLQPAKLCSNIRKFISRFSVDQTRPITHLRVLRLEAMCIAKGYAVPTCLLIRSPPHFSIEFAEFALVGLPFRCLSQASVVVQNAIMSTIMITSNIHRQATIFVTLDLISSRVCWSARGRSSTALNHVSGVHLNSA